MGSAASDVLPRLRNMELYHRAVPTSGAGLRYSGIRGTHRGQEIWRVLEVTYPDNIPAHTKIQKLYFDKEFMLKRLDYITDVIG
jgi:hypothetical protein